MVSWSYDMLPASEQLLFDRLSVFAGGFDLPAAHAVAGVPPLSGSIDEMLASLDSRKCLKVWRLRG